MKLHIAKIIFLSNLSVMKRILDLLKFKLGEKSGEFLYMKKQVMDFTYKALKKLFKSLEEEKVIKKCECKHSLRKGYSDCEHGCGGSGYINYDK